MLDLNQRITKLESLLEGKRPTPTLAEPTERDRLKEQADALRLEYPINVKTDKLRQMVYEASAITTG